MGKKLLVAALLLCIFASGEAQTTKKTEKASDPDNLATEYFSQILGVAVSATSNLKLYEFVYDWIGTPYRFGGSSQKGVDCSGFTKMLYDKVFDKNILRNSRDIFSMVSPLSKDELKEGDLVFFKNQSKSINHVGIYLGNNKFAHASSSRGVVVSNLNEPYYTRYFYRGGRVLDAFRKKMDDEN